MTGQTLALTGATGFVGSRLMSLALAQGYRLRALTRRPQPEQAGVDWISGSLDDPASLGALVDGSDAVIHVAGVVNAANREGFARGNIDGTRALIAAAESAGVTRFLHVSSLSAREPALSLYGWSKAEAEQHVMASPLAWTIVRPPAIYGPGDREMIDVYRLAQRGLALTPPAGRLSLIEVGDLARLFLALIGTARSTGALYEADDGQPGGWSHADYARMIGDAVGRRVIAVAMPRIGLQLGARIDRWLRGDAAKLTPDRAAYFCHPDWVVSDARRVPPEIWQPKINAAQGLRDTAAAYRAAGWL